MPKIVAIKGRQILDSRGFPTTEADVTLEGGFLGRAAVPSGASTGSREALELRDGDRLCYHGKSVLKAVAHINNTIAKALVGKTPDNQQQLDEQLIALDGTDIKSTLGANAILAVSLAHARADALARSQPLYAALMGSTLPTMPTPMLNVLNGGKHADNNVDVQEFMIVPHGATSFAQAMQMGAEIYHSLKGVLKKKGLNTAVGDEGGFAPNLRSNEEAICVLLEAIEHSSFTAGEQVSLALDCAASEFYQEGSYHLEAEGKVLAASEMADLLSSWTRQYPIVSIEDGMHEQDEQGWRYLTELLAQKVQLVGDDLFVTNPKIFKQGIDNGLANSILIKVNQIGTLTETLETIAIAKASGYSAIISHRSGETEDAFIADLAVATAAGQIKTGAPCRSDRVAKYNQLLRIEEAEGYPYAGLTSFTGR